MLLLAGLCVLVAIDRPSTLVPLSLAFLFGMGFLKMVSVIGAFISPDKDRTPLVHLRCPEYNALNFFSGRDAEFALTGKPFRELQEKIIHSAIRHPNGVIYSVDEPGRHHHVVQLMSNLGQGGLTATRNQGFVTNHGRYVDRKKAYVIARDAGQILSKGTPSDVLFSEEIWDTPDTTITPTMLHHHPDEPFFVLLGRDPQAPDLVKTWAADRERVEPASPKIAEALQCAVAMMNYKTLHPDMGVSRELFKKAAGSCPEVLAKRLASRANELVADAKHAGLVVTIDLKPKVPLTMGAYEMVPEVREASSVYRARAQAEAERRAAPKVVPIEAPSPPLDFQDTAAA